MSNFTTGGALNGSWVDYLISEFEMVIQSMDAMLILAYAYLIEAESSPSGTGKTAKISKLDRTISRVLGKEDLNFMLTRTRPH